MKAILQFVDYHVMNINFQFDPFFDYEEAKLSPNISFDLEFRDDEKNNVFITLGIMLGDRSLKENSLFLHCEIKGEFLFECDIEVPEEEKIDYYKVNGVAILYPYLRSLVSDITSKGSEQPIILPTMNIAKMIQDQEKATNH